MYTQKPSKLTENIYATRVAVDATDLHLRRIGFHVGDKDWATPLQMLQLIVPSSGGRGGTGNQICQTEPILQFNARFMRHMVNPSPNGESNCLKRK